MAVTVGVAVTDIVGVTVADKVGVTVAVGVNVGVVVGVTVGVTVAVTVDVGVNVGVVVGVKVRVGVTDIVGVGVGVGGVYVTVIVMESTLATLLPPPVCKHRKVTPKFTLFTSAGASANPHKLAAPPYEAAVNAVGQLVPVTAKLVPDATPANNNFTVSSTILPKVPPVLSLTIDTVIPFITEPVGIANANPVAFKNALLATVADDVCVATAAFVDIILPGLAQAVVPPLETPVDGKIGPAVVIYY